MSSDKMSFEEAKENVVSALAKFRRPAVAAESPSRAVSRVAAESPTVAETPSRTSRGSEGTPVGVSPGWGTVSDEMMNSAYELLLEFDSEDALFPQ